MRSSLVPPLLWSAILLLLAGAVAISITWSVVAGRDPPVVIIGLAGALLGVVVLALVLERPTALEEERPTPGISVAACQELISLLRTTPVGEREAHEFLLNGTPPEYRTSFARSDIPAVDLSAIIYAAAEWSPPVIRTVVNNALAYMPNTEHADKLTKWRKMWMPD